ncbi:type II toxin-antitoxin system RelE/ParE family toxin [Devosia elaeis]|uniref:Plasmid stabilization protein n=1 Tax=Devosia elaeis TaxID=1770058 RepID=A0A178HZK6_9HYPH|nr:type II toxin-antitoxin system RelE/ParE family toxin [Devosia elaeis]OAM77476.1 hypothetical protein A3840_09740 [Devosia elaeis]
MPLKIKRLPLARADRLDIWLHIAADNISAADRLTDRLDEIVHRLSEFPEAGPSRPELGAGIRLYPVDNFLIFYRVAGDAIEIVRILHAARDITPDLLSD